MQPEDAFKPTEIVLKPNAQTALETLERNAPNQKRVRSLLNGIKRTFDWIRQDFRHGQRVARNLFPHEYVRRYAIENLRREELPQFWRLTYTITTNPYHPTKTIVFILDILPHPDYDKLFGYRKK